MCCITPRVERVSNTNLFARLSGKGTQFLVYQMTYEAKNPVAMILPIPVALPAHENAVRFLNLKPYPTFFRDCYAAFPAPMTFGRGNSAKDDEHISKAAEPIRVETVGDFEASFVPSQRDFHRIDSRFRISKAAFQKLPQYRDYGFVVFQFKETHGTPHPMAFEFPTRDTNHLYFPTVHIHDGLVHPREHFDHMLYYQGGGVEGMRSTGAAHKHIAIEKTLGIVEGKTVLQRIPLDGFLPNQDWWLTPARRRAG